MKSAHNSVLKDPTRKVVLILLGDLPSKDFDADIRLFIKNQTFIKCDDKNFWEKLRYAIPDVKVKNPSSSRSLHGRTNSSNYSHQQSIGRQIQKPLPPIPPSLLLHHQQQLQQINENENTQSPLIYNSYSGLRHNSNMNNLNGCDCESLTRQPNVLRKDSLNRHLAVHI